MVPHTLVSTTIRLLPLLWNPFAKRYELLVLEYVFVSELLSFLTSTFFILHYRVAEQLASLVFPQVVRKKELLPLNFHLKICPSALAHVVLLRKS